MSYLRHFSFFFFLEAFIFIQIPEPANAQGIPEQGNSLIQYIDSLNIEAHKYSNTNISLLKKHADLGLKLSNRIGYEKGIAEATFALAQYASNKENYTEALDLFYMYLDYVKKTGNKSQEVLVCVKMALMYLEIKNFELGLTYCRYADSLALVSGKSFDVSLANLCYASYYYKSHKINLAIMRADSGLHYAQLAGNLDQEARVKKLLGDLLIEEKVYEKSIAWYDQALKDFRVLKNQTEIAIILTRLAHLCQLQGKYYESYSNSKEALKIRLLQNNQELISLSLVNFGTALLYMKKLDSAFVYYQQGLAIAYTSGNLTVIEYALKQLSEFYNRYRRLGIPFFGTFGHEK